MNSNQNTCGTCKYCGFTEETSTAKCSYYPPKVFVLNNEKISGFPDVNPKTTWCGKWEPIANENSSNKGLMELRKRLEEAEKSLNPAYVLLGYGGSFKTNGNFEGIIYSPTGHWINEVRDCSGSGYNTIYAAEKGTEVALMNGLWEKPIATAERPNKTDSLLEKAWKSLSPDYVLLGCGGQFKIKLEKENNLVGVYDEEGDNWYYYNVRGLKGEAPNLIYAAKKGTELAKINSKK